MEKRKKAKRGSNRGKGRKTKRVKSIEISELEDVTLWANFLMKKSKEILQYFDTQMKELEVTVKSGIQRAKHKENRQLKHVDAKTSNQPA